MNTNGGDAPPLTMAQACAELDRLAQARRELPAANREQAAELWSAEAQVWANLTRAPDFPLGTASGNALARAAAHARQFAERRAQSWRVSGGRGEPPADAQQP